MQKNYIDLTGLKFNKLFVLNREGAKNKMSAWRCKCDCGNIVILGSGSIKKQISCGCVHGDRTIDMIGKRCGRLMPIEKCGVKSKKAMWKCNCDCGNVAIVSGDNLRNGHTKSCGCAGIGSRTIDITGMKFGKLTVLKQEERTDTFQIKWRCKCDCGKETVVLSLPLRNGGTKTCGCGEYHGGRIDCTYNNNKYRSKYEVIIAITMDILNIDYEYEPKQFKVNINGEEKIYIPDFYLTNYNKWIEVKGYSYNRGIDKFNSFGEPKKLISSNEIETICKIPIRTFYYQWKKNNYDIKFAENLIKSKNPQKEHVLKLFGIETPNICYA